MKKAWTRGEKLLWAAPLLFGVVAVGAKFGPDAGRRAMGWPQVLPTTPTNHLYSIALAPDGSILAASGETNPITSTSGTIYLWDARTLQPLKPIRTNPGWGRKLSDYHTRALDLSPDGKFLGAQRDKLGYSLYHLPTSRLIWRKSYARYAEFSPDGKRLALGAGGVVTILNVTDGALIRTWETSSGNNEPYSGILSWSPDGKVIACIGPRFEVRRKSGDPASAQFIELRRVSDGKRLRTIPSELTNGIHFSPDGRHILAVGQYPSPDVTGSIDSNGVRLYTVATGAKIWEFDGRELFKASGIYEEKFFCDAIFSPDGKQVAAFQYKRHSVLLLDAATGREIRRLRFRETPANRHIPPALAFSPDGKRLFASAKSEILVWDLE